MTLQVVTLRGKIFYDKPPDGGWSWIVVVASFFIIAIAFGISKGLGIFFLSFKEEFGATNSQTSWISSVSLSMFGLGAPFASLVQSKIGARKLVMLSGFLCLVGMILASLATNIFIVYLGIGVINGLGFSWSFITVLAQIGMYFEKWRALANGIASAGSSVCTTVLPYLSNYLLNSYGWRGTILILGGIGLNISMFGALILPISVVETKQKDSKYNLPDKSNDKASTSVQEEVIVKSERKSRRLYNFLHHYWIALLLGMTELVLALGLFIPIIYVVPYCKEIGLSAEEATFILSMVSIGDIICRPLGGALITLAPVLEKHVLVYIGFNCLGLAFMQALAAQSQSFASLLIYAIFSGLFYGFIVPGSITAVPILFGIEHIQEIMGIKFFFSGLTTLFSPPIAGYLVDVYGTYQVAFWYALACQLTAAFMYLMIEIVVIHAKSGLPTRKKENSKKNPEAELLKDSTAQKKRPMSNFLFTLCSGKIVY